MIDVTPFVQSLNGKPVAVFGLGISNMAAIRALVKAGAEVVAWDDHGEKHEAAALAGAEMRDLLAGGLDGFGCLVLSPGVPLHYPEPHPIVQKARDAGVEILCDIEILHRCGHGRKTVGVTGTNGKSTTTALIGHVLDGCGMKVATGGNIGKAALDLDLPRRGGVIVLELSSFQLDLCPTFAPDIAVHLNLTVDHLDRHNTMEEYADSKLAIFRGAGDAVISIDDDWSRKLYDRVVEAGTRTVYPISVTGKADGGAYVDDSTIFDTMGDDAAEAFRLTVSSLPGVHNHQNAVAAYTVARLLGHGADAIQEAMKSFPGLPHRQFLVRVINGVAYVNDSKATNADATARALACYRNILWIAGGKAKDGGLDGLDPYMERIKHAFLIGEAAGDFADWLDKRGVEHTISKTMERAVEDAHQLAQSERGQPGGMGTVLLSPACASFDQFRNFEDRGDAFTRLVEDLPEDDV